ncbi:energy-coupling factor ABC transporter permease [Thiomicrorhabdus sp. 6S2-11]|uniref:Energy-coupling factor ABC transporter permease n=1 Tax=Thiomicrorhabdus marina TaxID=2818442 RepID=A0ABS3Q6C2_9GAMM|nr:energy-coupling factor ABC transporter permease [Thiomicrorhabdus marina]MBO1927856.1 energy-coupling factor ABC transporter permease [Thiomicrorhabdus marina]
MNLYAENLSLSLLVFGWLSLLGILGWALKTAPWYKVKSDSGAQNIWLFISVVVFFVWQLGASLGNGVTFHFLLMTMMTLMFGVQFAFIGMLLVLLGVTFFSDLGWLALGVNALLMGAVPILITQLMLRISERYLEQNFFVYVFFNAFLAAGVGVVLVLVLGGVIMGANEVHSFEYLAQHYFPFIPLMATPEGFVNGMLIAAIVLLKPHWLSSFSDATHLKK